MTREDIEMYHDMGLMPNWAYYQQCGITPTRDMWKRTDPSSGRYLDIVRQRQLQMEEEKELEELIYKTVEECFNKMFADKNATINLQL